MKNQQSKFDNPQKVVIKRIPGSNRPVGKPMHNVIPRFKVDEFTTVDWARFQEILNNKDFGL